ncbi:MAG: aromatic-ring-hydroxylating dioxygenase subunit beta [Chloroflexi bacterium]|nr:aromatic-ring-hydroxylating dioxygenase subunit beta [Chloroflexota bacterium]
MAIDVADRQRLHWEVEQFYFEEAQLLDARRLEEWVELIADNGLYTLSIHEKLLNRARPSGPDADHTEIVYTDDKEFMRVRVRRLLETALAHAEKPPSVTRRLISNIRVDGLEGEVHVSSNFLVFQARFHIDETTFVGTRRDLLVRDEGRWQIRRRDVLLDQFILARSLTTFF